MNMRYALRSEDTEQINVMTWARYMRGAYPELKLLHHCPNGGSRNEREAVKFKQMGVLAGVSDLHLPVPKGVYASLYIEMKYGNGRLEDSQKRFVHAAADAGNFCAVCYGAEEAVNVIEKYVKLKPGEEMQIPNKSVLKDRKCKPVPEPKERW